MRSSLGRLPSPPAWLIRLVGLGLLIYLLSQLDLSEAARILASASVPVIGFAFALLVPLIALKTIRWNRYLQAGGSWAVFSHSLRVYFSGLFLGFVTPGRLGEFARAYFVRTYVGGSTSRALLTVVADRVYDLAALLLMGGLAALALPSRILGVRWIGWGALAAAAMLPLLLEGSARGWLQHVAVRLKLGSGPSWFNRILETLAGLPEGQLMKAAALTIAAYGVFFGQGYLLARALGLDLDFFNVAQAVALGSLAALLPVSISGLGTREWAITLFLGSIGLQAERALAFSALLFLVFNVGGGLIGGLAWLTLPNRPTLSGAGRRSLATGSRSSTDPAEREREPYA